MKTVLIALCALGISMGYAQAHHVKRHFSLAAKHGLSHRAEGRQAHVDGRGSSGSEIDKPQPASNY